MGRWGELLFQGDDDLDEAIYISEDAGIELYNYEMDEDTDNGHESGGKGLEATQEHLNNGVLSRLFEDYSTKPLKQTWVNRELRLVLLAALSMRVGATIEPKYMDLLHGIYTKIPVSPKHAMPLGDSGFRGPMRDQFEIALAHYKNDGTPYNFYATRCENKPCSKDKDELEEGHTLKKCGKCKEVVYCSKECQAADWSKHKKGCKTPEWRAAQEERLNAGRPWTSLNV